MAVNTPWTLCYTVSDSWPVTEVYGKATALQNGCHKFKNIGIWPLKSEIFPNYMYAETTHMPLECKEQGRQQTVSRTVFMTWPPTQQQNYLFLHYSNIHS